MIVGLQISIGGEDLARRIEQRLARYEAELRALESRIKRREGDQPYDIRVDDGLETFGELEARRDRCRDKVWQLTLFRDGLIPAETYLLGSRDLRAVGLLSTNELDSDAHELPMGQVGSRVERDGLRVTMTGEKVHALLQQRIQQHQRWADRWRREEVRSPEDQTEDEPLLPQHMCANEAERHEWRAAILEFISEHLDVAATYLLSEADLTFGEILPEKPGWLEQEEYEERTSVGFQLEQLRRRLDGSINAVLGAQIDPEVSESPVPSNLEPVNLEPELGTGTMNSEP
jgi:hypothetical protein